MKKRLISLLCCATMLFVAGCDDKKKPDFQLESDLPEVTYNAFSLPGTIKIPREEDTTQYFNNGMAMNFEMARNENEGAQLILHPDQDVVSYNLHPADLVREGGGGIISASDIEVYAQFYIHIKRPTSPTSTRPNGYYPDALIPMDVSVKAGENTIKAGDNQGIWVNIRTYEKTKAGVYRGNFTLEVNGRNTSVPVTVTVWDFAIPDKVNIRSTFNLFEESLMGGQLNNTPEMVKTYVDYLLDYRVTTTFMVSSRLSDEDWLAQIKEYAADERVTCYDVFEERKIRLLIENSTPELNLMEKAFTYVGDEPYDDTNFQIISDRYNQKVLALIEMGNEYEARCVDPACGEGPCQDRANHVPFLEAHGLTKADIWGMELLVSMSASIREIDGLRTYCALVSEFDSAGQREYYEQLRQEADHQFENEEWWPEFIEMFPNKEYATTHWYVCVQPYEPMPNYHTETDITAARVLSWMQYNYDIDGVLTWGTATYHYNNNTQDTMNGWTSWDVYNEADGAYTTANGDGMLLYPGARYGLDTPLPSIRLMSIRDGFEDYEYIYLFEQLFREHASEYGIDPERFNSIMQNLYDMLYSGVVPKKGHELVLQARRQLAENIALLSSDMRAIIEVNEINIADSSVNIDIYASEGTTLEVDGKTYSRTGNKITYNLDLTKNSSLVGTLKKGESEHELNLFVSKPVFAVSMFDDYEADSAKWKSSLAPATHADREHIIKSENTDPNYLIGGTGSSMRVDIEARDWNENDQGNYRPSIYMSAEDMFADTAIDEVEYVAFWIYSDADFEVRLDFSLEAELMGDVFTNTLSNIFLYRGWNLVRITDIDMTQWELFGQNVMDSITNVKLEFVIKDHRQNYLIDETGAPRDYTFYIDNVYLSKR